ERGPAYEDADVVRLQRELGNRLEGLAEDARVVVQVAVVDVGGTAATAVGSGDEIAVAVVQAPGLAIGEGRVPASPRLSPVEVHRLRRRQRAETRGDRRRDETTATSEVKVPHVLPALEVRPTLETFLWRPFQPRIVRSACPCAFSAFSAQYSSAVR